MDKCNIVIFFEGSDSKGIQLNGVSYDELREVDNYYSQGMLKHYIFNKKNCPSLEEGFEVRINLDRICFVKVYKPCEDK